MRRTRVCTLSVAAHVLWNTRVSDRSIVANALLRPTGRSSTCTNEHSTETSMSYTAAVSTSTDNASFVGGVSDDLGDVVGGSNDSDMSLRSFPSAQRLSSLTVNTVRLSSRWAEIVPAVSEEEDVVMEVVVGPPPTALLLLVCRWMRPYRHGHTCFCRTWFSVARDPVVCRRIAAWRRQRS